MRLLSKTSIWMALSEGFASFCSGSRAALLPRFWRHSSMTHGCLEHDRRSVVSHLRHSLVFFLTSRQGHGHNNNGFSSLTMLRVNSRKAIFMQIHAPLTTFPALSQTRVLWNRTTTSQYLRFFKALQSRCWVVWAQARCDLMLNYSRSFSWLTCVVASIMAVQDVVSPLRDCGRRHSTQYSCVTRLTAAWQERVGENHRQRFHVRNYACVAPTLPRYHYIMRLCACVCAWAARVSSVAVRSSTQPSHSRSQEWDGSWGSRRDVISACFRIYHLSSLLFSRQSFSPLQSRS